MKVKKVYNMFTNEASSPAKHTKYRVSTLNMRYTEIYVRLPKDFHIREKLTYISDKNKRIS